MVKNFLLCVVGLWLCAFAGVPDGSKKGVIVIGYPKEGRSEQDGTGHYPDLVRAVLAEVDYPSSFIITPIKRSTRLFNEGGAKCMVPAGDAPWPDQFPALNSKNTIRSEPIDYVSAYIVTKPGTMPISDPATLAGKRVGAWVGASLRYLLPTVPVVGVAAESEESSIRMLMSDRVDAIVSWDPDVYILFDKLGLGEPSLSLDHPLMGTTIHFWCRQTPETQAFITQVNPVIREMRADGRLKKILGEHAKIVGEDVPMPGPQEGPGALKR